MFLLCYFHQFVYIVYTVFKKPKTYREAPKDKRYAILISARNEQEVIGLLLDSIARQDYPSELIDVYVCADNCTDSTADVCRKWGATVFERNDTQRIGKGYALEFMMNGIYEKYGEDHYDAYFVIDADNLLAGDFVCRMHDCFCEGNRVVTCYRNSKNFGDNWVSAGCGLWFLHVAKHLNNARTLFGNTATVSGTGFMVHKDIFKRQGGWKHFLLTEDIEFTVDNALAGEKIAYCHAAVVYDEQPTKFTQSWRQRLRWSRGHLQILGRYGGRLIGRAIKEKSFSCYDMLMNVAPAFILTVATFILNVLSLILSLITAPEKALASVMGFFLVCLGGFVMFFLIGVVTCITEWKYIGASTPKKLAVMLTFPIFMMTYTLIAVEALFLPKLQWKPIVHTAKVSIEDMK